MNEGRLIKLVFGSRDIQTYSEVLDYLDNCEMPAATAIKKALNEYVTIYLPKKETLDTTNPAAGMRKTKKTRKPRKTIQPTQGPSKQPETLSNKISEIDIDDDEPLFDEDAILAGEGSSDNTESPVEIEDNVKRGLNTFLGLDEIKFEM